MDVLDDFKKQVLKKIKKLSYENKKLKQDNDQLLKRKKQIENDLIISKSEITKAMSENQKLQKIISGQKRKIIDDGLVETDEEMELPQFLEKTEKIYITGERIKPKQ